MVSPRQMPRQIPCSTLVLRGVGMVCFGQSWTTSPMHLQGKSPGAYTARGFLGLAWIDSGGVDGTRTRDPRRDRPVFSTTEIPLLAGSLSLASCDTSQALRLGDPTGIRTPVLTVKG